MKNIILVVSFLLFTTCLYKVKVDQNHKIVDTVLNHIELNPINKKGKIDSIEIISQSQKTKYNVLDEYIKNKQNKTIETIDSYNFKWYKNEHQWFITKNEIEEMKNSSVNTIHWNIRSLNTKYTIKHISLLKDRTKQEIEKERIQRLNPQTLQNIF